MHNEKKQTLHSTSKYVNALIVAPTSDICEQLFSRAKHIMTPTRRRMDPSTLEDILLLKFNTDLWNAQLVQKIIEEEKDQNSLRTPGSASTLLTSASSGGSSGSTVVDIVEDEDNADEKETDYDD